MNTPQALLVGIDEDGERRESWEATVESASLCGRRLLRASKAGPAWRSFEVWANDESGAWKCVDHA